MDNLPFEIIANLIASVIGAALGLLAARAHKFLTFSQPVRRVWGNLVKSNKRLMVVVTSLSTMPEEGNRAVTTVAESTALANVLSLLEKEYKDLEFEIYPSNKFPAMRLGRCLLVTGGPRNNMVTRLLMNRYDMPFRFEDHDLLIDDGGNQRYAATIVEGAVVKDYGIIVAMRNPFDEDCYIYLVAGCYAYGVNAALRALTWPNVKRVSSLAGVGEFLILVEADVVDEYVSVPQIIAAYTLCNPVSADDSHYRQIVHPS